MKNLTEKEFVTALENGTLLQVLENNKFDNVSMKVLQMPETYAEFEKAIDEFVEENMKDEKKSLCKQDSIAKKPSLREQIIKADELTEGTTRKTEPTERELFDAIVKLNGMRSKLMHQLRIARILRNVKMAEAAKALFDKSVNFCGMFTKEIRDKFELHANLMYNWSKPDHFTRGLKLEKGEDPVAFEFDDEKDEQPAPPQRKEYSFIYEWSVRYRNSDGKFDRAWGRNNLDKTCVHINVDEKMAVVYDKQKLFDFINEHKLYEQCFAGKTLYEQVATNEPTNHLIRIVPANIPDICKFVEL